MLFDVTVAVPDMVLLLKDQPPEVVGICVPEPDGEKLVSAPAPTPTTGTTLPGRPTAVAVPDEVMPVGN